MGTAVSGSTMNLSASSTAASPDTGRNAANGVLGLSFSDLLRGQIQSGAETRTPEPLQQADARPAPAPTRTPPPSTTETPRPSQPTRDPARTTCQNSPPETGQSVKQQAETQETSPPPQQASTGTDKTTESSEEETTSGNTTPNQRPIQPQLADATISPELPATIAALLIGIAGEIAEDDAVDPETLTKDTPRNEHTGHFRQPETSGNLPARTATSMQAGVDMENDVGDDGNGTNTPALLTGRASKENLALTAQGQSAASASGTGKEAAVRVNATAPDVLINAVSMTSMASRESSDARTVPAGVTANAGDIPMLNPPRLPTQVGAALPQFTIPSGAGQRAWAEEVGNRVMWMLGRAESRAELILTPPLLGKVEVSIHLNGDQGTAQFLASSQSAREALEQAMPRLRELLAQAGISLGEASVNTSGEDQAPSSENTHRTGSHAPDAHGEGGEGDATVITAPNWTRLDSGIINTFA